MKYIIDHDLHLHSRLSSCSRHPEQTCENLLRYAKEMGYSHICLTDHFWDSEAGEPSGWYRPQNYEHVTQALPLPTADGVRFDFGCEADMDKDFTLKAVLRPYGIAQKCGCKFYLSSDAHTPEGLLMARQRFEAITEALNLTEEDKLPFVAR